MIDFKGYYAKLLIVVRRGRLLLKGSSLKEFVRPLTSTLFRQYFIAVVILSIVPIVSITLIGQYRTEVLVRSNANEDLKLLAIETMERIYDFLNYLKSRTMDFASDGHIRDRMQKMQLSADQVFLRAALSDHLANNKLPLIPEAIETFVVDLDGIVVGSSDSSALGRNLSTKDFFRDHLDAVYVGDIFIDTATSKSTWLISSPIRHLATQEVVGVLYNRIEPVTLSNAIYSKLHHLPQRTESNGRFGKTGEAYIVNASGWMITESRFIDDATFSQRIDTEPILAAWASGESMSGEYPDYRGVMISGTSVLLDYHNWILLTEIDLSEILQSIRYPWINTLLLAAIFLIMLLIMNGAISYQIINPLYHLINADEALIRGDEQYAFIPERDIPHNEIGKALRLRNAIIASLQEREYQRNQKLSGVVDSMSEAVVITDSSGKIEYVNPAWTKLTKYTFETVLGIEPWNLPTGEHDEIVYKQYWDLILANPEHDGVMVSKKRDGELYFEERTITPVIAKDGSTSHMVSISRDITKRILAIEALSDSEERYKAITKTAMDAIVTVNEAGIINLVNPSGEKLFGYSLEELIGENITIIMPENYQRPHEDALKKYTETNVASRDWTGHQVNGLHKDGHEILLEISYSEYTAQGERYFVGVLRDITVRKKAEADLVAAHANLERAVESRTVELAESNEKYRNLFEDANDSIFIVDPGTGQFIDANQNAASRLGYSRAELLQMTYNDIDASVPENNYAAIIRDLEEKGSAVFEQEYRSKDGVITHVEVSSKKIKYGGKEVYQSLVRDITARKRANEQVRKLSQAVEQSPTVIVITDLEGVIEYVNPKFTALTGYTAEEAIGQKIGILSSGDHPKSYYQEMWQTISTGQVWNGEFCNRKKSGELFWESATISPIKTVNSKITHYLAIKEDITEQRQLEKDRKRLLKELELKNADLEQIVQISSHDLRSPLTSISLLAAMTDDIVKSLIAQLSKQGEQHGYLEILQPLSQMEENLDKLNTSSVSMQSILDGLMGLSKLGQAAYQILPVDMNTLVHQCVINFSVQIDEMGATVEIDNLPRAQGDAIFLAMVCSNILGNALKYRDPAKPCSIHIQGWKDGPNSFYCIEDNGIGIDPSQHSRVFEAYQRINDDFASGYGLGLSICKRIMKRLEGDIWVESKVGVGSKFYVSLPSVRNTDNGEISAKSGVVLESV